MFSSVNSEVYSFQSNWKKNFATIEFTTQTDTYKIVHRGLNIKKHRNNDCQTDSYLYVEEDIHLDVDESELNNFIKKVVPTIHKVLLNNERSNTFNANQTDNGDVKENICLYKIENKTDEFGVKNVSQLSWNCNGTVLAAAFGDIIHNKWCVHTNTGIGIFSLSARNKTIFEDKPDTMLETTTCACCVQFHYYMTSLLVAGTHNGEIIVWDRSRPENDLILASSAENKVHEEPINSILWSNVSGKTISSNYCLVSMGNDGTIVMWNLSMRKSTLVPLNCYNLTARDLPKSVRYRGSLSKSISILCGSLNSTDNEYLVIGSEVGVLFLCNIKLKSTSSIGNELKEIKSPVESVLATVSGAVHSVQWSKALPNFVAAVAATGIIYIYNVEHKQQIAAIDPGQGYLYDLSLSPLIPGLIVTSGENGTLVLMNFLENNLSFTSESKKLDQNSEVNITKSEYTILKCNEVNTGEDSMIINCVEFNEQGEITNETEDDPAFELEKKENESNINQHCHICEVEPKNALIMPCKHMYFCISCVSKVQNSDNPVCPSCGEKIKLIIKPII